MMMTMMVKDDDDDDDDDDAEDAVDNDVDVDDDEENDEDVKEDDANAVLGLLLLVIVLELPEEEDDDADDIKEVFGSKFYTYTLESWIFEEGYTTEILLKHFNTHSLKGFGIEAMPDGIVAAGAVLHYLKDTEHPNLQHITSIQRLDRDDFLWMDKFTIRNLELLGGGAEEGQSLLKVLNNTISPMGSRLLKRWLIMPLKDIHKINERLDWWNFS